MEKTLKQIKEEAEEIRGQWDGDTPKGEDEANIAGDIVEAVNNLEELLAELN